MTKVDEAQITEEELAAIRAEAMELANVGLYRYRLSGEIIFIDRQALRLVDLHEEYPDEKALIGRKIGTLLQPVVPAGTLRATARETGSVRRLEYPYKTLKGEERWAYHTAYLVEDPGQPEPAIQVISQDITSLKRAERSLAASEARYRSLVEGSLQGVVVFTGDPPRVVFANGALGTIFGLSPEAIVSGGMEGIFGRIHPEDREELAARFRRRLAGEPDSGSHDFRILRPDGETRWVTGQSTHIVFDERPSIQSTVIDITERKVAEAERLELEAQMQRAQRLESLGVLAGGIAHDFNNILAAVLGHAELAAGEVGGSREAAAHLEEIGRAAERASELCRQMMAYAGQRIGAREPVDLGQLVVAVCRLMAVSIPKKVDLRIDEPEAPVRVEADPTQLRQVVLNLISNASEAFGGEAGTIRVLLRAGEHDRAALDETALGQELPEGRYVALEVEDTGCGIDEPTLARVFEPFCSTKAIGRGLGLSAVLGIVRSHRGTLRIESTPGVGTRFVVLLPQLAERPPATERAPARDQGPALSGTALLVDDEAIVREMAARMLRHLGLEVVAAADGLEAVARAVEHRDRLDVAILDLSMPGLDGREVYEALRGQGVTVPVLFSSAYDVGQVRDIVERGDATFLQKPYRLDALRERLAELLSPGDEE